MILKKVGKVIQESLGREKHCNSGQFTLRAVLSEYSQIIHSHHSTQGYMIQRDTLSRSSLFHFQRKNLLISYLRMYWPKQNVTYCFKMGTADRKIPSPLCFVETLLDRLFVHDCIFLNTFAFNTQLLLIFSDKMAVSTCLQ